jgi:RNA polymerase sigma-54 factor
MKLSYNLRLSQSLKLTPLLQQSLKFLQASQAELDQLIEEYIKDNIFLEKENSYDAKKSPPETQGDTDHYYDIFENQSQNQSLKDYLVENIGIFSFSERDQLIFFFLIDCINDDGYLSEPIEVIIKNIPSSPPAQGYELEKLLKLIQQLSLPGIGARDLSECLLLQLNIIKNSKYLAISKKIAKDYLNLLGNKNYEELKKLINCSEEDLNKAIKLIKQLNPKPGQIFKKILPNEYVKNDVTISLQNNKWEVYLNEDEFNKVKLREDYDALITDKNDKNFANLKEKFQEAKWLIKNLNQRSITLLRVSREIMKQQIEFLEKGESFIKPLSLKDVATELELHESTISRVTNNKFIRTPHGLYELKYFFSGKINKIEGDSMSSKALLTKIKYIIDNEDHKKPYSDEKIVLILGEQGINIARRTISKYRGILKILPSSQRKI